MLLPSKGASFCKPYYSSCRLAEDSKAANTKNYCLCMAKDGCDFIASWVFHIHEVGIGALQQVLLLVFPLLLWRGMREILCKRHVLVGRLSLPEREVHSFFFFFKFIFGCVGSSFRVRAFSSCGKRGPLFIAVRRPFTIAASLVVGHRLQTRRLSSCGSRA